ncbi:ABC transporter ATP-binding protein [Micrococcus luteus]|uniref:ABC transporter ATP-binding protein n=1 Tax=Micrococcus luteus TaxID=1270 RepID=UPI003019CC7F
MTTLTAPQADLDALRTPAAAAAHRVAGERPVAAADATPALSVRDLVLEYPDGERGVLRALDEVSLDLLPGTFTAMVGPSGSGKSSLLAVAAGLVTPTSGSVSVAGREMAGLSRKERTALRGQEIGMIFQQPNLIPSLTAAEQLELTVHLDRDATRADRRAAKARALELLERVDLADQAGKRPHQLSGGQRQRVNIVRALMASPTLLLVDEPTSALDRERSAAVVDLLGTLTREEQVATLMVTHDHEFLSATDRTLTMVDGRLSAE